MRRGHSKFKTHPDVDSLLSQLVREGWRLNNKKNHIKIYSPDGVLRTVAGSSLSDPRGVYNIRADIKRARARYDESTKTDDHLA